MSPESAVLDLIATHDGPGPMVLGIAGPQGSGKSTVAANIVAAIPGAASLSLDDLYLTRTVRRRLAAEVHPLLATRGVPGTHDVALGLATIAALRRGEAVRLPRFDKGADDRVPAAVWPLAKRDCPLVVIEGWCLGAPPEIPPALARPINPLEAAEDANGAWRGWVNDRLAHEYLPLWAVVDKLIWLAPPGFDTVFAWRAEQEAALRRAQPDGTAVMDKEALIRFVAHYERITRHMISAMPARADMTIQLDAARSVIAIDRRKSWKRRAVRK